MKIKFAIAFFVLLYLLGSMIYQTQAQQDEYRLNVNRSFGYSSGSQIRGTFNMEVVGPQNIKSVTYLLDGEVMAQVTTSPFYLSFQTTKYANGWHNISALVETTDGRKVTTPSRRFEFATAEQESGTIMTIIFPLLGGVLLIMVIGMGIQMFILKNKPAATIPLGAPRNFGLLGGSVCPQCQRAFPIHWYAPNLGFRTKFDRCEFCGKWSIVKILNQAELNAALVAELEQVQPPSPVGVKSEEDQLKEMIEKSRYIN
jgi:hypothetical protein